MEPIYIILIAIAVTILVFAILSVLISFKAKSMRVVCLKKMEKVYLHELVVVRELKNVATRLDIPQELKDEVEKLEVTQVEGELYESKRNTIEFLGKIISKYLTEMHLEEKSQEIKTLTNGNIQVYEDYNKLAMRHNSLKSLMFLQMVFTFRRADNRLPLY